MLLRLIAFFFYGDKMNQILNTILIIHQRKNRGTYVSKTFLQYKILFNLSKTPLKLYHFPITAKSA